MQCASSETIITRIRTGFFFLIDVSNAFSEEKCFGSSCMSGTVARSLPSIMKALYGAENSHDSI